MFQLFEAMRGGTYSAPKTVLGFFITALAILTVGCIGVTDFLTKHQSLHYLIPYELAAVFVFFVALVGGIFVVMLKDATKLQLGQVSSSDFINYQIAQGDDIAGERLERLLALQGSAIQRKQIETSGTQILPPAEDAAE
jgi:hypothetical protein